MASASTTWLSTSAVSRAEPNRRVVVWLAREGAAPSDETPNGQRANRTIATREPLPDRRAAILVAQLRVVTIGVTAVTVTACATTQVQLDPRTWPALRSGLRPGHVFCPAAELEVEPRGHAARRHEGALRRSAVSAAWARPMHPSVLGEHPHRRTSGVEAPAATKWVWLPPPNPLDTAARGHDAHGL